MLVQAMQLNALVVVDVDVLLLSNRKVLIVV